jgi:hypothetical protein
MSAVAQPRRWRRAHVVIAVAGVVLLSPVLLAVMFARAFADRR